MSADLTVEHVREVERRGVAYRIEILRDAEAEDQFFAYVSDTQERIYRTRNCNTLRLALRAAQSTIREDRLGSAKPRAKGPKPKAVPPTQAAGILAYVGANPCCDTTAVAKHLGQSFSTVRTWMLKLAGQDQLIPEATKRKRGWHHRWCLPSTPRPSPRDLDPRCEKATRGDEAILAALRANPGATVADVSLAVLRHAPSVHRSLERLRVTMRVTRELGESGKPTKPAWRWSVAESES